MNTTNKNKVVNASEGLMQTLAGVLVSIFDGLKAAIDHANPSLFALVATLLPFALPLPVAFMTSESARHFFGWDPWAANVLGFGLEGLGLLAWVKLVDAVLEQTRTRKAGNVVALYGAVAVVYELLLVFVNVVLAAQEGASGRYIVVLTCVCLLPALSAITYGHQRQQAERMIEQERADAKAEAERLRQERRQDRKEAAALRAQYASETEQARPFRGRNGKH